MNSVSRARLAVARKRLAGIMRTKDSPESVTDLKMVRDIVETAIREIQSGEWKR